ncbi:VOC family protein [Mucilaginibacter sp. UR6-1]|uniref:VOC family protein n=1 Tax=Mucilaginibacter sp. UR6-1 TaxID=1435643 RepID=UPI001E4B2B91|nr:VOC family protein [Mucilaginibacter sp. UR6-1]MCC8411189.1 VOC family protein [Mucilaginibacter sp. UR6-1]
MKSYIKAGLRAVITALAIFTSMQTTIAQSLQVAGVDHIGINVPDLKQAIQFFTDVMGFKPVTQIGPVPLDSAWKNTNHMQAGTGPVTIKMVRAGTGANIELFWFDANKGSSQQPGGDDAGATHIAFYTPDIKTAVAYLKAKGIKVLGDPFTMPSGDTAGETWVYFETPWGSKMELVSYPEGKGYEKTNPGTLLWSPKNFTASADTTSADGVKTLVQKHLLIWNEKSDSKRKVLLTTAYAADIEMIDRHFVANGYADVERFVKGLQQKDPTYQFKLRKPVDIHHNIARLYWQFGSASKPNVVTGMDMFVIQHGKIKKLYVFVDGK